MRDDPEFAAALADQEERIARERRAVERMLLDEDSYSQRLPAPPVAAG